MSSGVFLIPDKRIPLIPNIGIIVGREYALVVDCGLVVDGAESILAVTRDLAPGRKNILTITHAHPEHGYGAHAFSKDAVIFYNAAQKDYLLSSGSHLLKAFRSYFLPTSHHYLLDGIEITEPHQTYAGSEVSIDLGGRTALLRTWGTSHSPGDQIVFLPEERILFAGDLVVERMFPIVPFFPPLIGVPDINLAQWECALEEMVEMAPKLVVPGHGNLGDTDIVEQVIGYFPLLRRLSQDTKKTAAEKVASIRQFQPTWENPEFIGPALGYLDQMTKSVHPVQFL
ncbi:MBL fold metallo-hydrolase [Metarhizobium album]|uniref:MBL fold metallo-hydrolase n=1 Tax=Metarhizobium album TaxID=2182425 RepID=A0A2U2DJJ9_9HYPH|nr:MBL fold metallo-hydrolase [Rhizobium album]